MAVTPSQFVAPVYAPNVRTVLYTSTAANSRIDYMAWTNTSAANAQITVWIGPAGTSQARILGKTILPNECYLCPEVIGALLIPGQTIEVQSTAATALYGAANGVTFT